MSAITPENDVVRAEGADEVDTEITAEVELVDTDTDTDIDIDTDFDTIAEAEAEAVPFSELGLPEELVRTLAENGVQTTFPIQAATIPDALAGRHVLGKARTGSGKTLAFGLAALANLKGRRARKGKPLALVLVPTRELAMQVSDALQPYGFAVGADIAAVYGGAPMYKQVFALRRGVEVLVATPGRLTDLIEQEECDLSEVEIAVLDEADQMADMGFMPIVSELLSQTDPAGQRLLFSATLDGAVDELVRQYMTDPVLHSVTPDNDDQAQMDHHLLIVEPADKALVTAEIAARHTPGDDDGRRTILFARTKLGADRIAEKIREAGVSALALHGGMTQRARTKTLADFKEGRVPVLVATDVAARGIHVDGIDLVLHVDPAGDPKDYLHRAGRTARAGESGTVVTLVLPKQRKSTMRLLESAGVEAELTKVAPSSETLRELTGGRPVAEYVAEADAYHAARRAAREARMGEERREGGFRGRESGGGGFRGGERRTFGDRDRFDRGHRGGGRFEEREGRGGGFGGRERSGSGAGFGGERSGSGFDRNRGGFDRKSSQGRSFDRDGSQGRSFDRDGSQGRGFDRNGSQGRSFDRDGSQGRGFDRNSSQGRGFDRNSSQGRGFDRDNRSQGGFGGGERRSFGDRDGSRGFGGEGRFDRNASGRGFDRDNRGGERRSFSDRDNRGGYESRGGERRSFGDRDRGGFDRNRAGYEGRNGGERRSYGDRDSSQGRGFDRSADRRSFGDRGGAQGRGFGQRGGFDGQRRPTDRDNRNGAERDRNGERRTFGERTAFGRPRGGYSNEQRDNRPPRDRRW